MKRGHKRRRRRMALRKTLFILPNLFSLAGLFAGIYSILLSQRAERAWDFWAAATLVGCAVVLKAVDVRVTRLTRTQTDFSLELDSISDLIAFGVAPAWLIYHWGLSSLGLMGAFIAFTFVVGVVSRLARLDLAAKRQQLEKAWVSGLPAGVSSALLAALIATHSGFLARAGVTTGTLTSPAVAVTLMLALLMVVPLPFRTFRKLPPTRRNVTLVAGTLVAVGGVSIITAPGVAMLALLTSYVALHLAVAAVRLERWLVQRGDSPLELDETEETEVSRL